MAATGMCFNYPSSTSLKESVAFNIMTVLKEKSKTKQGCLATDYTFTIIPGCPKHHGTLSSEREENYADQMIDRVVS